MRKIREVLQLKWEDGLSNLAIGKKYGIGSMRWTLFSGQGYKMAY